MAYLPRVVAQDLGFEPDFEAEDEVHWRIQFLVDYLRKTKSRSYVLGISGGIDSTLAGVLAQRAVDQVPGTKFIAVRLPYGNQKDEKDAQDALKFINPSQTLTINIKNAVDKTVLELMRNQAMGLEPGDWYFHSGNIKARQRMIVQYAIAGANNGLVIGTDHAAEAVMGFFTKFGDGAADVVPLRGLNKRRIRGMAEFLKVPSDLIWKTPTADLETNKPLLPDEVAFGVTYDEIDDFLEGKRISIASRNRILEAYTRTKHKRQMPIGPYDDF